MEEALSSMLWTPYDQDVMVESPPYQRRNRIEFPLAECKGQVTPKMRYITLSSAASSRFSFPFISSVRPGPGPSLSANQIQNLPSYDEIASSKRLSMPPHPYLVPTDSTLRTRVCDESIVFNVGQVSNGFKNQRVRTPKRTLLMDTDMNNCWPSISLNSDLKMGPF